MLEQLLHRLGVSGEDDDKSAAELLHLREQQIQRLTTDRVRLRLELVRFVDEERAALVERAQSGARHFALRLTAALDVVRAVGVGGRDPARAAPLPLLGEVGLDALVLHERRHTVVDERREQRAKQRRTAREQLSARGLLERRARRQRTHLL